MHSTCLTLTRPFQGNTSHLTVPLYLVRTAQPQASLMPGAVICDALRRDLRDTCRCVSRCRGGRTALRPMPAAYLQEPSMTDATPVYFDEGSNGTNKYTFEVYREKSGVYTVFVRRWNARLNLVQEETRFTSPDKAGLREFRYPNSRMAKAFLASDFWSENND